MKILKLIMLIVLTIAVSALSIVGCAQAERPLTAAELIDLGERYLLDLNFEQALAQFTRVIEIDPMNPRGYTGAAEAHLGLGRPDDAESVLRQGLEHTGDGGVQNMLQDLEREREAAEQAERAERERLEAEAELMQRQEDIRLEAATVLDAIAGMDFDADNYEISALLESGELRTLIEELSQFTEFPIFLDTQNGRIGIFYTSDGHMIYQGDFSGDIREGFGRWFCLWGHYFSEGQWSGDIPNGQFAVIRLGRYL